MSKHTIASTLITHFHFARMMVGVNLKANLALRGAFLLQSGFMLLNNALFFVTWWILLARFEHIRGWQLPDVACLYAVAAGGVGMAVVLTGGVRDIARKACDGELDVQLTRPKSVLLAVSTARMDASGFGDCASSLLFLVVASDLGWSALPWALLAMLCAGVGFAACAVLYQSSAFWFGRTESLARSLWEFTLSFSMYPPTLFDGSLRVVLFTLLPAGVVSFLPVEVVRNPSWTTVGAAVASVVVYAGLAGMVFHTGLRRYESGNRMRPFG